VDPVVAQGLESQPISLHNFLPSSLGNLWYVDMLFPLEADLSEKGEWALLDGTVAWGAWGVARHGRLFSSFRNLDGVEGMCCMMC